MNRKIFKSGRKGDAPALLPSLKSALLRFPDNRDTISIETAQKSAINTALNNRGDPFAREDMVYLKSGLGTRELRLQVSQLPVVIGRNSEKGDADLQLPIRGLSARHFELVRDGAFIMIRDLGSKNGTFVNGRKIDAQYLCEGDVVAAGTQEWRIERL